MVSPVLQHRALPIFPKTFSKAQRPKNISPTPGLTSGNGSNCKEAYNFSTSETIEEKKPETAESPVPSATAESPFTPRKQVWRNATARHVFAKMPFPEYLGREEASCKSLWKQAIGPHRHLLTDQCKQTINGPLFEWVFQSHTVPRPRWRPGGRTTR